MKTYRVLSLIVGVMLCHNLAHAQCTSGSQTGGTIFFNNTSVGTFLWTQPQNAQTLDGVYSTISQTVGVLATVRSNYLVAQGFGFNIPAGATICGVTVQVHRIRLDLLLGDITDNSVKLLSGGSIAGINHASATSWSTTEQTVTYGGASDTWGLSLTPAIVNNANFGVGVSATMTGGPLLALLLQGGIDYISIAITYNNGTLPITLEQFSVVRQNNTDVLSWTATDDDAGDQFIVQRSGDAQHWQNLTTIPAQTLNLQYSYTDQTPLDGTNFYRLYLQNKDAQGVYSEIKEIGQGAASGISCYPNPVINTINISSPKPIGQVTLRDMQGKTILSRTGNAGSNTLQLPAGDLPPGIYMLKVDGTTFKLVKQ